MPAEAVAASRPIESEQFQTDRVLTITAGHAVHDTYTAFLPPLLPAFIENLALSKTEAGLLTVFNQLASVTQPFIGHLADRFHLRTVVILAPAVTATLMSLLGVAPSYAVLAVLLLLVGLSSAALHSVAPVLAGRLSGRNLGRGMGFWMLGGELGRTLGPLAIVFAVQYLGLGGTPWLMAGGWLASALLWVRLRDVPARPQVSPEALGWRGALATMRPFLVPLIGVITVRAFMSAALTTYLPVLLTEEGAGLTFAGISLSVLEAAGVAGALLGGTLSDRLGRKWILLASLLTTPGLMVAFLAIPATGWGRFPLLLLMGLTALSTIPVIMALVQESFPDNRALANGVYMALSFLIRSVAVVIVGATGDVWGMRSAFLVTAGVPLLGIPFLFRLPGTWRRSTS